MMLLSRMRKPSWRGSPVLGPVSKPFNFRLHTLENTFSTGPLQKRKQGIYKKKRQKYIKTSTHKKQFDNVWQSSCSLKPLRCFFFFLVVWGISSCLILHSLSCHQLNLRIQLVANCILAACLQTCNEIVVGVAEAAPCFFQHSCIEIHMTDEYKAMFCKCIGLSNINGYEYEDELTFTHCNIAGNVVVVALNYSNSIRKLSIDVVSSDPRNAGIASLRS